MTTKSTVLVVGSTRMLGFKIVAALLDKGTFDQLQEASANAQAYERQARRKLWQLSESLCQI